VSDPRRDGGVVGTAMILAAGLGTRMRPLSDHRPKALIEFQGRPLIDFALDRLRDADVGRVVVNVHYLADMLEAHVAGVSAPEILISDERTGLLDTGGGIANALPLLGEAPFFVVNADSVWTGDSPNLARLAAHWDDRAMDCLMLIAPVAGSHGYKGAGDFLADEAGRLRRAEAGEAAPFANTGYYLVHPRLFDAAPAGPFSINLLWDRAIAAGRLSGMELEGTWLHIGTPEALREAEQIAHSGAV